MHHTIRIQRIVLKYHAKANRSGMHTELRYANDMASYIRRSIRIYAAEITRERCRFSSAAWGVGVISCRPQ